MDLFDVLELFIDWKAAGERHGNGNIYKSIEINKERFKMSDQLVDIFTNTAERLGYARPIEAQPETKQEQKPVDFVMENIKSGLAEIKNKIK